jgi:hypothetical protein
MVQALAAVTLLLTNLSRNRKEKEEVLIIAVAVETVVGITVAVETVADITAEVTKIFYPDRIKPPFQVVFLLPKKMYF